MIATCGGGLVGDAHFPSRDQTAGDAEALPFGRGQTVVSPANLQIAAQPIRSAIGCPPLAIFMGRPRLDVWTVVSGMPNACATDAHRSPGR